MASDQADAARAGMAMLERGGNAVDAAVAASFALSVTRPMSCGIGGGGFMVIRLADDPRSATVGDSVEVALNYREMAPLSSGPSMYEGLDASASMHGGLAVATPGTVMGLLRALDRYGTLPRDVVLAPAIALAEEGFESDAYHARAVRSLATWVDEEPGARGYAEAVVELFGGRDVEAGDVIRNPDQGRALRLIAAEGWGAFDGGAIGRAVVGSANRNGGRFSMEDFGAQRVHEGAPLTFEWAGRRVLTMAAPSSGGAALGQILQFFEGVESEAGRFGGPAWRDVETAHALVEAKKHAFAWRTTMHGRMRWGDVERMVAPAFVRGMTGLFDPARTLEHGAYGPGRDGGSFEDGGTSHISVVDGFGGAAACTETINTSFGSKVLVEGFGFCLNNEMDDFTTRSGANAYGLRQSEQNRPTPGARPLSSMTPTVVLDGDGEVEMVVGASGGPRIISAVAQVTLNALRFGLSAEEAVDAPRVHHQWSPDRLLLEPSLDARRLQPSMESPQGMVRYMTEVQRLKEWESALEERGHALGSIRAVASCQALVRRDGVWEGAADAARKGGLAMVREGATEAEEEEEAPSRGGGARPWRRR